MANKTSEFPHLKTKSVLEIRETGSLFEVLEEGNPSPLVLKTYPLSFQNNSTEKRGKLVLPNVSSKPFIGLVAFGKSKYFRYIVKEKAFYSDVRNYYLKLKETGGADEAQEKIAEVFLDLFEKRKEWEEIIRLETIRPSRILVDFHEHAKFSHLFEAKVKATTDQEKSEFLKENEEFPSLEAKQSVLFGRILLNIVSDQERVSEWELAKIKETMSQQSQFMKELLEETLLKGKNFSDAFGLAFERGEEISQKSSHDFNIKAGLPINDVSNNMVIRFDDPDLMDPDPDDFDQWKEVEPAVDPIWKIPEKVVVNSLEISKRPEEQKKMQHFWPNVKYVVKKGFRGILKLAELINKRTADFFCSPNVTETMAKRDILNIFCQTLLVIQSFRVTVQSESRNDNDSKGNMEMTKVMNYISKKLEERTEDFMKLCGSRDEEKLMPNLKENVLVQEAMKRLVLSLKSARARWGSQGKEEAFKFSKIKPSQDSRPSGYYNLLLLMTFVNIYLMRKSEFNKEEKEFKQQKGANILADTDNFTKADPKN